MFKSRKIISFIFFEIIIQWVNGQYENCNNSSAQKKDCPSSCADLNITINELRWIYPNSIFVVEPVQVICQRDGWTIIQKRDQVGNPSDFFVHNWMRYKQGFGDVNYGEYWIGNDNLWALTTQDRVYLQIILWDFDNSTRYGETGEFRITNNHDYKMIYDGFKGDLESGLPLSGAKFSTYDRDNDLSNNKHCAKIHPGGWWFNDCPENNLNGLNLKGPHIGDGDGINWHNFKGMQYSLKSSIIRIRPLKMKN